MSDYTEKYGLHAIGITCSEKFNREYLKEMSPILGDYMGVPLGHIIDKLMYLQEKKGKISSTFHVVGIAANGQPNEEVYQRALDIVLKHSDLPVARSSDGTLEWKS